jgi:hypothetical protein
MAGNIASVDVPDEVVDDPERETRR